MAYFKFVANDPKKVDYADGSSGLLYAKELMAIYDVISTPLEKSGKTAYTEWSFREAIVNSRSDNYVEGIIDGDVLVINNNTISIDKLSELNFNCGVSGTITKIRLNGQEINIDKPISVIPNTNHTVEYFGGDLKYVNTNEVGNEALLISTEVLITGDTKRSNEFNLNGVTQHSTTQLLDGPKADISSTVSILFDLKDNVSTPSDKQFLSFYEYMVTFEYNNEVYAYEFTMFKSSTKLTVLSKRDINKNNIVPYEVYKNVKHKTYIVFKDESIANDDSSMLEAFARTDNIITIENVGVKLLNSKYLTDTNSDGWKLTYSFSNDIPYVGQFNYTTTNDTHIHMRPLCLTNITTSSVKNRVGGIGWNRVSTKDAAVASPKRFCYKKDEFASIKTQTDDPNKYSLYLINFIDGSVKVSDIINGVESNTRELYNVKSKFDEGTVLLLGNVPAGTTIKSIKDESDALASDITNHNNSIDLTKYLPQINVDGTQTERIYSVSNSSTDNALTYDNITDLNIQPKILEQIDAKDYFFPVGMNNTNRVDLYDHASPPTIFKDSDFGLPGLVSYDTDIKLKYPVTLNGQNYKPVNAYALNGRRCSITINERAKGSQHKSTHYTLTMSNVSPANATPMVKQLETYISAIGFHSGSSDETVTRGFKASGQNIIFDYPNSSLEDVNSIYDLSKDKIGLVNFAHYDTVTGPLWSTRNTVLEHADFIDDGTNSKQLINYVLNPYEDKLERFVGMDEHNTTLEIDGVKHTTFNHDGWLDNQQEQYVNDQVSTGISNHRPMDKDWEDKAKTYDMEETSNNRCAPVPVFQPTNLTGGLNWTYPIAETVDGCLYINLEDGKTYAYGLATLNRFGTTTVIPIRKYPTMLNSINIPSLPDSKRLPHLALDYVYGDDTTMLGALSVDIFQNHTLVQKSSKDVVCVGTPVGLDYLGGSNVNIGDTITANLSPASVLPVDDNYQYNIIKEGAIFSIKDKTMHVRTTIGLVDGPAMPTGLDTRTDNFRVNFTNIDLYSPIEDFTISTVGGKYTIDGNDAIAKVPKDFALTTVGNSAFVGLDINPALTDGYNRFLLSTQERNGAFRWAYLENLKVANYHNDTTYTKNGVKHIAAHFNQDDDITAQTVNDRHYSHVGTTLPAHIDNVLVKNSGITGTYAYSSNTTDTEVYIDTRKGFHIFTHTITTGVGIRGVQTTYNPLSENQSGFSNNIVSDNYFSKIDFLSYLRDWRDTNKHIRAEHNYSALI